MQKNKRSFDKKQLIKLSATVILLISVMFSFLLLYTDYLVKDEAEAAAIKQGSTGAVVKQIQEALKTWGFYKGKVDGIYGAKTTEAVKAFQRKNNATADGIVGQKTASLMGIDLSGGSSSGGSTSNDLYLLAKCVYGEARGEPYVGQVAVAAIILNRVKSSEFPNTIAGVIYQPWAFTAVNDGQINLAPDDSAKRAAQDAMNGWDPTYGCLYYYNPVTATNQWIRQKEIHLTIGRHVFCL